MDDKIKVNFRESIVKLNLIMIFFNGVVFNMNFLLVINKDKLNNIFINFDIMIENFVCFLDFFV